MNKRKSFASITNESLSTITGGADSPQPAANPSDIYRVCGPQGADFAVNGRLDVKTPVGFTVGGEGTFVKCLPHPSTPTPGK
jgi:hypothetical protein